MECFERKILLNVDIIIIIIIIMSFISTGWIAHLVIQTTGTVDYNVVHHPALYTVFTQYIIKSI